jgi:hypothetical protein
MTKGSHQVRFSCEFYGEPAPDVAVTIKSLGNPEIIRSAGK